MKNKKYYRVYVHTVLKNNKKYVGLSTQKNIHKRWRNGKGYMGQVFYNAVLKYGWNNISHKVYECDTEAEMKYLEKYLIAYYNTTDRRYGYNISTGGEYGSGVPSKHRKAIDQYSKDGQLVKTWDSIRSAAEEMNWSASVIATCVRKERPTAYNYYWCPAGETPKFKTRGIQRKVYQFDLKGNLIGEYKNAAEAARILGRSSCNIIECCNGNHKRAFGFYWSHSNSSPEIKPYKSYRKVCQYDLNGNFIREFESCAEAARSFGRTDSGNIIKCCKGKLKTLYGFIFKYEC